MNQRNAGLATLTIVSYIAGPTLKVTRSPPTVICPLQTVTAITTDDISRYFTSHLCFDYELLKSWSRLLFSFIKNCSFSSTFGGWGVVVGRVWFLATPLKKQCYVYVCALICSKWQTILSFPWEQVYSADVSRLFLWYKCSSHGVQTERIHGVLAESVLTLV